mgnify:CR=1 FL=1
MSRHFLRAPAPPDIGTDLLKYAATQELLYEILKGRGEGSSRVKFHEPISIRIGRSGSGPQSGLKTRPGIAYDQRDPVTDEQKIDTRSDKKRNALRTVFGIMGSD